MGKDRMKRITTPLLNVFYSFFKDFFMVGYTRPLWHGFRNISEVQDTCFQATSFENVIDTGNHLQVAERWRIQKGPFGHGISLIP